MNRTIFLNATAACVAILGCSGKTTPHATDANGPVGDYALVGTYTTSATNDPKGAPAGFQPPVAFDESLNVTSAGQGKVQISWRKNGNDFPAQVETDQVVATDAVSALDAKGSLKLTAAVTSLRVKLLRWSVTDGTYREVDELTSDAPGMGPQLRFVDARIAAVQDKTRHWVSYGASTNFPWDFADGAACVIGGSASSSGNLGLSYGSTADVLRIYFQGIGCEVSANRTPDGKFAADGADCPLDPELSLAALGITSFHFETFAIDLGVKQLSFVARATRSRDDGRVVDMCWKLDSGLTGDFPSETPPP